MSELPEPTKRTLEWTLTFPSREAAEQQARHAAAWDYLRAYLLGPDSAGWFSLKQERVTRADAIATGAAPIPKKEPKS